MSQESTSIWRALSNETASAVEKVAPAVVAVHGRRRIPSSGVHWKPGIVVTADHTISRDDEITITLPDGANAAATLAGRDPSTDIAILKVDAQIGAGKLPVAEFGDLSTLKAGHLVLTAARTSEGEPRASLALVGVVGPAWRTWRGGTIDVTVRLDRNLHPNFSGGPVVGSDGRVLGMATSGLSRYGAVVIPSGTVDRVTAELEKKGHIGRGYLGIGMAPVRIPRQLRESLKLSQDTGVLVMGVEAESPAEKAGVALGDLFVTLDGSPVRDTDDVQSLLSGDRIGKPAKASIIRGGALTELAITVGERPIG
ncbi:MAG TPA: S1C family serine protease [Terriglobia bacterium]|nr:S1C family serine protease [Terriglobia bacterium]